MSSWDYSGYKPNTVILGEMQAWTKDISLAYSLVDSVNSLFGGSLLSITSRYGSVDVRCGTDLLVSFPNFDLETLDRSMPRLKAIADFAWSVYKFHKGGLDLPDCFDSVN